jgi:hypothetical protein
MKWVTLLFAISFGTIPSAHAQRASIYDLMPDQWKDIKLGPFVSVGECLNTGTVSSTSPGFAYSAGAVAEFPVTQNISFTLALAYDAMSVYFDQVGYSFNYVAIRPEFSFNGLLIAVGIGLPVSSSATGTSGSTTNFGTSAMNTLFQIRFGGCIPLLRSTTGELDLTIEGAYAFTQIVSSELTPSGTTMTSASTINNGPLATGEIGIQYLFDLGRH